MWIQGEGMHYLVTCSAVLTIIYIYMGESALSMYLVKEEVLDLLNSGVCIVFVEI